MYLLDTNVVSELRRPKPHPGVIAWLESVADTDLHLSAVTIGEIQAGIEVTREQDAETAASIEAWLEKVEQTYNVLPMDARAFRQWARLLDRKSDDLLDHAMIVATAKIHNLTVVTRNVRDFDQLGIAVFDPFAKVS